MKFNAYVAGYECDAVFFSEKLVIEVDHYATHGGPLAFEEDRKRDADIQALGFRVLRVTAWRLEHDAEGVLADIKRLLALGPGRSGLLLPH